MPREPAALGQCLPPDQIIDLAKSCKSVIKDVFPKGICNLTFLGKTAWFAKLTEIKGAEEVIEFLFIQPAALEEQLILTPERLVEQVEQLLIRSRVWH